MNIDIKALVNSLSPEDVVSLFTNMIGKDSGGPLRFTASISKNATVEELRRAMEQFLKLREGALDTWEPLNDMDEIEQDFKKVLDLIKPQKDIYLKLGYAEDKFEELEQIGKFIIHCDPSIIWETHDPPLDFPDAIVRKGSTRIGIEHTRLIDGRDNAVFGRIKACTEIAENLLKLRYPQQEGIINLSIAENIEVINGKRFNELTITPHENAVIAENIADYLAGLFDNSITVTCPDFITTAYFSNNPGISISITLGQSYFPEKNAEALKLIKKAIVKKESRYFDYAALSNPDEIWLLIVVQGVKSSSGYKLSDMVLPSIVSSQFDKIIVFDSFNYTHFIVHHKDAR